MKSRRRLVKPKRDRGVALIMVIVITTVLAGLATDLSNDSQVNLTAAANARDELQAHFHARSALEIEFFVLKFQRQLKGTFDKFLPVPLFELSEMFVTSDTIKGIIDKDGNPEDDIVLSDERSFSKDNPVGNFQGSFWIEDVVDENRKININNDLGVGGQSLLPVMLFALFSDKRYDPVFELAGDTRDAERNRLELIRNIIDWRDGDNNINAITALTNQRVGGGAEDARFSNLPYEADYEPKNGKFDSVAELRLVPGVNDAIMQLFAEHLTVWTEGTDGISMRTASDTVIRNIVFYLASPKPDKERLDRFMKEWTLLKAVPGAKDQITDKVFSQTLKEAEIRIDDQVFKRLTGSQRPALRFDDISGVYRITAIGRVNDASSRMTVVWRDDSGNGEIMYWRED